MWMPSVHWWEFILRGVVVYVFVLLLLRLTGKRQVGDMSPFDLVLLLILSEAVQNSMNGNDSSITGGLILAATLVGLNWVIGWLTYSSKRIENIVEGTPLIVIHEGKVLQKSMQRGQITKRELDAALRANGCASPEEVRFAVLENNGQLTVIRRENETKS